MAVRLPVILSQPARRDASATDLVENLVAAALMIPGLDANLIGDISAIEPGSTDHICLLGHARDLVLASFLELSEARAAWMRLEQNGDFVDLGQDESAIRASLRAATPGRKVFYFQLALGQPVDRLLEPCRRLLAAQQLSLVSIQWGPTASRQPPATNSTRLGLPTAASAAAPPGGKANAVANNVPGNAPVNVPSAAAAQATANRPEHPVQAEQSSHSPLARVARAEGDEHEEWSALDQLVDDLDALDL